MLKIIYDSGNDSVAYSQKNINSKLRELVELYKSNPTENNVITVSQADAINAIGNFIFVGVLTHNEVTLVITELNKELHFDEEGILTEFWYSTVPSVDY